ncbi:MAG: hypothetical protein AAB358_01765 [Patescibacteria group bacterium]
MAVVERQDSISATLVDKAFELEPEERGPEKPRESEPETEEKLVPSFQEKISDAASVDELIEIIQKKDSAVAKAINRAEEFLHQNMAEIVLGVLADKRAEIRNDLGNAVAMVNNTEIEIKVKELMKKEMAAYFEENRPELVQKSIGEARNLPELFFILKQFKGINGEDKRYSPEEAMEMINGAQNHLEIAINQKNLLSQDIGGIENKISGIVSEWKIPEDSGINGQVKKIFLNHAKELRLKKEAEKFNGGIFKKIGKRISSWFKR